MASRTSALSDGGATASFSRELLAAMVFRCSVVSAIWSHSVVPSSLLRAVAPNRDVALDLPTVQPETRDEWETHLYRCHSSMQPRILHRHIRAAIGALGVSHVRRLRWNGHLDGGIFVCPHGLCGKSLDRQMPGQLVLLKYRCRWGACLPGLSPYLYIVWGCNALMRRAGGGGRWTMRDCSVMDFLHGADWERRLL